VLTGVAISAIVLTVYVWLSDRMIDKTLLRDRLVSIGLDSPTRYLIGAVYWITVNSVLEEYVWRWFCVKQCEALMPLRPAVVCSALFFTLHHVLALNVYLAPLPVLLCSAGVFAGGAVWSLMYARYRSIWPGYLSHAIVDICVFAIGARIAFGSP
jgi:membrane protease YdiL (CAAX protease family)